MELQLADPVVVARSGKLTLIANGDVLTNKNTDAQTWEDGVGYSRVRTLQLWLKFLYNLEEVSPPEPWIAPGAQ